MKNAISYLNFGIFALLFFCCGLFIPQRVNASAIYTTTATGTIDAFDFGVSGYPDSLFYSYDQGVTTGTTTIYASTTSSFTVLAILGAHPVIGGVWEVSCVSANGTATRLLSSNSFVPSNTVVSGIGLSDQDRLVSLKGDFHCGPGSLVFKTFFTSQATFLFQILPYDSRASTTIMTYHDSLLSVEVWISIFVVLIWVSLQFRKK